jgi:microcystin-dependent protein
MATPFIGEIRIFAGNFAPVDWAFCNGALMAISQNAALFNLIGTTYGGDGQTTFALPDLRGRVPVHQGTDNVGNTYVIGQEGGVETVTLNTNQIPQHTHLPLANLGNSGTPADSPAGNVWSGWTGGQFSTVTPTTAMSSTALSSAGGSQSHDNLPPFVVINFIIALYGVYPSQS